MNSPAEQIFISYAREDFKIAKKIYGDLKKLDLSVWWDYESLLPGDNWKKVISKEIKQSKYFLALLSKNSLNKSGYVQKELKIAYEILQESPSNRVFVIPILIEQCEPFDDWLLELNWVIFFKSYKTGLNKLLSVIAPNAIRTSKLSPFFIDFLNFSDNLLTHDESLRPLSKSSNVEKVEYEEIKKYTETVFKISIKEEYLKTIHYLCDGNPPLIQLALDTLVNDNPINDLISNYPIGIITKLSNKELYELREKYFATLTRRFIKLKSPLDIVVLTMSLLPKLFTTHLCSYVLDISLSQAQSLLASLRGYYFIKHDVKSDLYTIHESIQNLLVKYYWADEISPPIKKVILERATRFYKTLIMDLSIKMEQYQKELNRMALKKDYDKQISVLGSLEIISKKSKLFDEQLKYLASLSK